MKTLTGIALRLLGFEWSRRFRRERAAGQSLAQ